jgi:hypothetical protein
MVTAEKLIDLRRVHLTIDGDHSSGKFCTMIKVFRFQSNPTISCIFQITSVSHSKDELSTLFSTVVEPIGEGICSFGTCGARCIHINGPSAFQLLQQLPG